MTPTRRFVTLGLAATALAACQGGAPGNAPGTINARVDTAIDTMYARLPFTRTLANQAEGMLIMPGVVKAGFVVGAAYGEGALRLRNSGYRRTAQFYSFSSGSVGWQAGAQKTSHAIFFLTPDALATFRRRQGWEAGADAEVTLIDTGVKAEANTTNVQNPVVAVVFGQQGLLAGASLEGAKYTPITP
ncbi:MAG: YSC84-related protein [Pseudomonadota bacterium]